MRTPLLESFEDCPRPLFRRPLIFLAEDDAPLRRALRDVLQHAGFDVLTAMTGRDMLKLLAAVANREVDPPDAVVMDVRMPHFSGFDVLAVMRASGWKQPIVIMSGCGDADDPSLQHDASAVLRKPVGGEELVGTLELVLAAGAAREGASAESVRS